MGENQSVNLQLNWNLNLNMYTPMICILVYLLYDDIDIINFLDF